MSNIIAPPVLGDPRLPTRFWDKITVTEQGCWNWTAALYRTGYACFAVPLGNGGWKRVRAHRHAYLSLIGPISDGLQLDHLCRNRACVNPDHLEPVTGQVNVLRGKTVAAMNSIKDRCKNGHAFDEANTYLQAGKYRQCRTCQRDAKRRFDARRREMRAAIEGGAR